MAWTVPLTAVSNATLTAAQWNASVRDNLLTTAPALATTASGYFAATGTNTLAQRTATGTFVGTDEATSSTSYTNLTTAGPAVTVTSGVATLVCIGAWITNATGGARSLMSYAISGATTQAAQDITSASAQLTTTSSSCYFGSSRTYLHAGLTAGSNTFTSQYKVSTGTGNFAQRTLSVLPL
jgi:hypothetical protein